MPIGLAEKLASFSEHWQPRSHPFVVPRGDEPCPVAAEEVHLLLVERRGTPNPGDPATAAPRREI